MSEESAAEQAVPPAADAPGETTTDRGAPATPGPGLAAAYRRLLRAYPRRWRDEHADEMVTTLLDAAQDPARTRPTPAEIADLVGNGLATRARALLSPVPPGARTAVSTLALATGAVLAAVFLAVAEQGDLRPGRGPQARVGPLLTDGVLVYAPWLVAFCAAALGRVRAARLAAAAVAPMAVLAFVLAATTALTRPPLAVLGALSLLAVVAAGTTTPPSLPSARRARQRSLAVCALLALGWVGLVTVYYRQVVFRGYPPPLAGAGYGGTSSLYGQLAESVAPTPVGVAVLAVLVSVCYPGWVTAVAVTGGAVSLLGFARIVTWDRYAAPDHVLELALLVVIVALAGALDLTYAARRGRRRAGAA